MERPRSGVVQVQVSHISVALAVLLTGLAGCLVEETPPADEQDAGALAAQDAGNETDNASLAEVVALIEVFVDGNLTSVVNGSIAVPAALNVTLSAANSTGDNLTFAWDFGDNATGNGSSVEHAFAAGSYNVTLTATGSENATGTATVLIEAASSAPAAGAFLRTDIQEFSDTLTDPTYTCGDVVPTAIASFTWTIPAAEPDGTMVQASRLKVAMTGGSTAVDVDLFLYGPDGAEMASGTSGDPDETIELTKGPYPAGDYTIEVRACVAVNSTAEVVAEADLVTA